MTPSAAASPKAEPPARQIALIRSTRAVGRRRSVSRVPGAEPRTSTPATAPVVRREDDRAAGQPGRIGPVADPQAGDVAQREVLRHGPILAVGPRSAIMGAA